MSTSTLMSFEQFAALPDGPDELELLEGELIRMPPSKRRHMEIVERLYDRLKAAVESLRTAAQAEPGKVHVEMGYLLTENPHTWLKPDVSITHPDQAGEDFYNGSPRIVFEIVSSWDKADDLNRKVRLFLRHGAAEVWVIYPKTREAWVHSRDVRVPQLEEEAIRSPLLPGIEIPLAAILDDEQS